jgi:hypothetical protein
MENDYVSWSYKHNLAIPKKLEKRKFTGGLSRLVQVGYSKNVLKLDYSSLYPSIQLVHDVFPACDVTGAMKSMLKYFRDTRIKYKNLASEYKTIDPNLQFHTIENNYQLKSSSTHSLVHYQHLKYFRGVILIWVNRLLVQVDNIFVR